MVAVAEIVALAVVVLATMAEILHSRRCARVASLVFGPSRRPAFWAFAAPGIRVVSLAAVAWSLVTLATIEPMVHKAVEVEAGDEKHILLLLDVSPSMRLKDAGPDQIQSRMQRAASVMDSFFKRIPVQQYRVSVIAFYNEAKAVVVDTSDLDVVQNILSDLPMHYAFSPGETDIFSSLREGARIARPWQPRSTTLVLISDGDTIPAVGMPKLPASISDVLVVGVGDERAGSFINGRHSKQDVSTLRQLALRLRGTYHNGNEFHLSTALLKQLTASVESSPFEKLTRREYALAALTLGSVLLGFLPMLLHFFGTSWNPGVRPQQRKSSTVVGQHVSV